MSRAIYKLRIVIAALGLAALSVTPSASAQVEAQASKTAKTDQDVGDSVGALPGIIRVGVATPLGKGAAISAFAGYGFLGSVLEMDDSHHRAAGHLAMTLRLTDWVGFGVRFDGRYDKHNVVGGDDDGYVGDPRIIARLARQVTPTISIGAHLDVWLPGAEAPSLVASATTVEAIGLVSAAMPSGLTISGNVGFRLDNSAEAVDDPGVLSLSDRLALGLSESNAVLGGLGISYRVGDTEVLAETTYDLLIGGNAPPTSKSPLELGAGVRYSLTDTFQIQAYARARITSDPSVTAMSPLVAVNPRVSAMAGLHYRFGGPRPDDKLIVKNDDDDGDDDDNPPGDDDDDDPPEPSTVKGRVVSGGAPISDAVVTLAGPEGPLETTTSTDGEYVFEKVAGTGDVDIEVKVEGFKAGTSRVALNPGQTVTHDVELERILPPGQIRGVVRDFRGQPVIAEITIMPLGKKLKPDAEGVFSVDVAPGEYEVVVEHPSYRPQRKQVKVEKSLVTILNIDMQKP